MFPRLDDLIFFSLFILLDELGSSSLSFFTLTNNNTSQSPYSSLLSPLSPPFISRSVEGHGIALTPWRLALSIIIMIYNSFPPFSIYSFSSSTPSSLLIFFSLFISHYSHSTSCRGYVRYDPQRVVRAHIIIIIIISSHDNNNKSKNKIISSPLILGGRAMSGHYGNGLSNGGSGYYGYVHIGHYVRPLKLHYLLFFSIATSIVFFSSYLSSH